MAQAGLIAGDQAAIDLQLSQDLLLALKLEREEQAEKQVALEIWSSYQGPQQPQVCSESKQVPEAVSRVKVLSLDEYLELSTKALAMEGLERRNASQKMEIEKLTEELLKLRKACAGCLKLLRKLKEQ